MVEGALDWRSEAGGKTAVRKFNCGGTKGHRSGSSKSNIPDFLHGLLPPDIRSCGPLRNRPAHLRGGSAGVLRQGGKRSYLERGENEMAFLGEGI